MNFKDLYNQKNKKDLLIKIENEPFDRITLSFYKYTKLTIVTNVTFVTFYLLH